MAYVITMAIALVGGWFVPWFGMKVIMTRRFKSGKHQTTNYAGKIVSYGLGLVWLVWAASLFFTLQISAYISNFDNLARWITFNGSSFSEAVLTISDGFFFYTFNTNYIANSNFFNAAIPLVVSCFFFGWLDDRLGEKGDGGFKGHVKSLFQGKLTTGMVKVLGIGFTALVVSAAWFGLGLMDGSIFRFSWEYIYFIVLSTCAIALSANLINLFDLRPARASKAYIFLIDQAFFIIACTTLIVTLILGFSNFWAGIGRQFIYVLWLLGPIFAIWRFDAGEKAMLGDAGANPAGALVGFYVVAGLFYTAVGLVVLLPLYVLVVLALNLLSEKYSFSKLIEDIPLLKRIDMLGRPIQKERSATKQNYK